MKFRVLSLMAFMLALFSVHEAYADVIKVGSTNRNYIKYIPDGLGNKRPLLISMHGMNQDAAYKQGMMKIESVADTAMFAVVFPEGIDRSWDISGMRDIEFVLALIDEMVEKYDIDPGRVYLSGFSMGGMFTYHAMNKIADRIAAFAPISGYPMYGGTYTSSRPVPIIHTHGTGDDVVNFSGVQNILNGWIQRNGCPTTPEVIHPYRTGITTRRTWGPGEGGVEVVLMELEGKGHWVSNDGYLTGEEIWNFCKRYSLNSAVAEVKITYPVRNSEFLCMGGPAKLYNLTLSAQVKSPESEIVSVDFYGDGELISTVTDAPYNCVWNEVGSGNHNVEVVATDSEGTIIKSSSTFNVRRSGKELNLSSGFTSGGIIPAGWQTFDGSERRIGPLSGLGMGARILQMTGNPRDFDYAMYTRNTTGDANCGYMAYGAEDGTICLMLTSGSYTLEYTTCNWNMPDFGVIRCVVSVINSGDVLASKNVTPTTNVGNTGSNPFSGATVVNLGFEVTEPTYVKIEFYSADSPWSDALIAKAKLTKGTENGIDEVLENTEVQSTLYYDLTGRQVVSPKGVVIKRTIYNDGKVDAKPVFIR